MTTNDKTNKTIPPGYYTARAVSCAWDTTREGKIFLAFVLRITSGEYAGQPLEGKMYFDDDKPNEKGRTTLDRSMEALRAMGLKGELDQIAAGTANLAAGDVEIKVEINASGYSIAKYINAPRAVKTWSPPAKADLDAFLATVRGRGPKPEAMAPASSDDFGEGNTGAPVDDDIPF